MAAKIDNGATLAPEASLKSAMVADDDSFRTLSTYSAISRSVAISDPRNPFM